MRRVVITGLGCVSPLGNTVNETWESAKNGKSGIGPITLFDTENYATKIAGEVKNFKIEDYGIDRKEARKMARFSQFLLAAATEAVKDAGYTKENLKENKTGICVGNCMAGFDAIEDGYKKYFSQGASRVPPLSAPLMLNNEAAANVSKYYDLRKTSLTIATACASGTDAIGVALDLVRSGRLDVCISGGTEAVIQGFIIAVYSQLSALSSHYNDTPEKASRPFDKDRDGFVYAEGSTVLILEELEHAKARGAKIYAELAGYGSSSDAYHITAPRPDGSGAAIAVQDAIEDAGLKPEDVDYYNAHGTSTHANDITETNMLKLVFGEHAKNISISSTKSMTGHMIGAAGATEALFCIKAINDGFIPPTINLDNPDIEGGCDLNYTPNKGVSKEIKVAASSSLGFGGHNGCIVLKKYEE